MYLYFNRTGVLKEIINDEALRQGNFGVNKLYIYIERDDVQSLDVSYILMSNLIIGPQNYTTTTTAQIPFNAKRDLKYFKYYTDYTFFVVDLEQDIYGHSPLDQAGTVHCSINAVLLGNDLLQLGDVNFNVMENPVLNLHYVAPEEYMSLSDYLFLRHLIQLTHYENYVALYSVDPNLWDTTPTLNSNKPVTSNGLALIFTDIGTALNNRYTKEEVNGLLANKADITDIKHYYLHHLVIHNEYMTFSTTLLLETDTAMTWSQFKDYIEAQANTKTVCLTGNGFNTANGDTMFYLLIAKVGGSYAVQGFVKDANDHLLLSDYIREWSINNSLIDSVVK